MRSFATFSSSDTSVENFRPHSGQHTVTSSMMKFGITISVSHLGQLIVVAATVFSSMHPMPPPEKFRVRKWGVPVNPHTLLRSPATGTTQCTGQVHPVKGIVTRCRSCCKKYVAVFRKKRLTHIRSQRDFSPAYLQKFGCPRPCGRFNGAYYIKNVTRCAVQMPTHAESWHISPRSRPGCSC